MPFPDNEGNDVLPSRSTSFAIRKVSRDKRNWSRGTPHQPPLFSSPLFRSNWNLKMLLFVEGGKTENLEKNVWSEAWTSNKLNPHLATGRNRTRSRLVGGHRSFYWVMPEKARINSNEVGEGGGGGALNLYFEKISSEGQNFQYNNYLHFKHLISHSYIDTCRIFFVLECYWAGGPIWQWQLHFRGWLQRSYLRKEV